MLIPTHRELLRFPLINPAVPTTLTRISHHPSATTAKLRVPSGRAPSAVLSGLKARLRASPIRAPRIHRQFDALAAKPGEKSGLTRYVPVVGALATALIVKLAMPEFNLWPLAFFTLTPLLWGIRGRTWGVRLLAGAVCGAGIGVGCFPWVWTALDTVYSLPWWGTSLIYLAFLLVSIPKYMLFTVVVEPLARRSHRLWPVTAACLWVCVEWVVPEVIPWHVGTPFLAWPPLFQVADITGSYGPSFLVALVSVSTVTWMFPPPSGGGGRQQWRFLWPSVAVGMCGLSVVYGLVRIQQIDNTPVDNVLKIVLIHTQTESGAPGHRDVSNQQKRLERLLFMPHDVYRAADVIVWPEAAVPGLLQVGPDELPDNVREAAVFSPRILEYARAIPGHLVVGALTLSPSGVGLRNSVVHFGRDGTPMEVYVKRLLVPFVEYSPLESTFPTIGKLLPGIVNFDPGDVDTLLNIDGVRVLPTICYEAIHTTFVRNQSNRGPEAQVLLNVSSDALLGVLASPGKLHLAVQKARAIELRIPLVRAANKGVSVYVDEAGREIEREDGPDEKAVLTHVVVRNVPSMYRRYGDLFVGVTMLFVLGILWKWLGETNLHRLGCGKTK
ncbi:MAG: apolipoprotein N-acyltransferase [Myxococcales bacterium]|nr:apolipoprotein N-acyltransferase [Myxococcales bacterium]